ncbi:MAG TPA: hypothetical protein VGV92_06185 [Gammaproteobacteria bacterium]|nr:hypothetical protein [Gammaproteobacteria bacterium]
MHSTYAEQDRKTVSSFEAGSARVKKAGFIANAQFVSDLKKLESARTLYRATFGEGKLPQAQLTELKRTVATYNTSPSSLYARRQFLKNVVEYVLKPLQHKKAAKKLLRYFQAELSALTSELKLVSNPEFLTMSREEFQKSFNHFTPKEQAETIVEIFSLGSSQENQHPHRIHLIRTIEAATSEQLSEIFEHLKKPAHIRASVLRYALSGHASQKEFLSALFFSEPKVLTSNEVADAIRSLKSKNREKEAEAILVMLSETAKDSTGSKKKLFCLEALSKFKESHPDIVKNSVSRPALTPTSNTTAGDSSLNSENSTKKKNTELLEEFRKNGITFDSFLSSLDSKSWNYEKTKKRGFEQAIAKGSFSDFFLTPVNNLEKKKNVVNAVSYIEETANPGPLTRLFRFLMSLIPLASAKKSVKEAEELTLKAKLELFNITLAADVAEKKPVEAATNTSENTDTNETKKDSITTPRSSASSEPGTPGDVEAGLQEAEAAIREAAVIVANGEAKTSAARTFSQVLRIIPPARKKTGNDETVENTQLRSNAPAAIRPLVETKVKDYDAVNSAVNSREHRRSASCNF